MSETVEILGHDDVLDIVRGHIENVEFLEHADVYDIVRDHVNDYAVCVEDIDTYIGNWMDVYAEDWVADNLRIHDESEIREIAGEEAAELISREIDEIGGQSETLEQRVARLEAVNAKLLDTLGQFTQLLSHRDLI